MKSLDDIVALKDELSELLGPASTYNAACPAEQVPDDLLVIQTLPLDLALAGFKVSIHRSDASWRISIDKRIHKQHFRAQGRGVDYVAAFASLHRAARKSLEKLAAAMLADNELEIAA